ncbi:D-glycero-alpha-D-manno-heptose-1,7-bisphosphate 7-phosphatase [Pandoraea sputorum]|uniref:D,D-heptose 1,7-bisphosphate phosphatase n=1 Tax=Pandoraea sputorum TaxID=93222 RepID=A0A5E5BL13_9BURK|nr:HAD family hydrolase [Pandoraea sputorum]VVE85966.1 D-glycero-beta-D-manno-heptose-1,7-bisphosphate 7-phosphatase [Pandoraea sputorum]
MARPALFLDRDGVINVDHAYVYQKENFDFIDGIFELVAAAKRAGYLVVVVTNQAGIGRGYYTPEDFHVLMDWVEQQFVARGGALDAVYYCPNHPEHGIGPYRQDSEERKPRPGMLLRAARELDIDLPHSIMVGDKASDAKAGQAAGLTKLFYFGTDGDPGPAVPINSLAGLIPHLESN